MDIFNPAQRDFINERIVVMKAQILHSILTGTPYADKPFTLPAIKSYGDLHDLCDANTLGGWCDDVSYVAARREALFDREGDKPGDDWMTAANEAQDAVDEWITSGSMASAVSWIGRILDAEQVDCLLSDACMVEAYGMIDDLEARVGDRHGFSHDVCEVLRSFVRPQPKWMREFPRFANCGEPNIQNVVESILAEGFADDCWHNDAAPKFIKDTLTIRYTAWVAEFSLPREGTFTSRFTLCKADILPSGHTGNCITVYETNDLTYFLHALRKAGTDAEDFAVLRDPHETAFALLRRVVEAFDACAADPSNSDLIGDISAIIDGDTTNSPGIRKFLSDNGND